LLRIPLYLFVLIIISIASESYSQLPARFNRKTNFKIEKRDSFYGALDSNGKVLIPFEYQDLIFIRKGILRVKQNNKFGLINTKNQVVIPIEYDEIERFDVTQNKFLKLIKGKECFAYNQQGKMVGNKSFSDMQILSNGVFLVLDYNKQFLMDTFGNIISNFYSSIEPIGSNSYIVVNNNTIKKEILLSRDIRILDVFKPFPNFYFQPKRDSVGLYGLIDVKGQEMLPLRYDYLGLNDNLILAVLNKNNKDQFGYFDRNGCEILPVIFDSISNLVDNTIVVKLNNKYRLFNSKGKPLIGINFDSIFFQNISYSKNAYFSVYKDGKCGLLNTKGKFILPMKYQNIGIPNYNLVNVRNNSKMGFLDLKGNIKISFEYEFCSPFLYGYARVSRNNKIGFIDTTGKVIIPIIYDASSFLYDSRDFDLKSYFRIKVKLGNRIFWINERNQYIEEAKDE
jgi:hypothetical protein